MCRAVCDVSSYEQVRDGFASVVDMCGTIDGVAACASVWAGGDLESLSPERIRREVEVNALGTTYVLKEALHHLHRQGYGNVVYTGAMAVTRHLGLQRHQELRHEPRRVAGRGAAQQPDQGDAAASWADAHPAAGAGRRRVPGRGLRAAGGGSRGGRTADSARPRRPLRLR
ncbi:SDR family NAD(P)-dependent oxidoreductase [Micromonospora sp. NPDC005707]|uniref:SDR family NAD(P)-dependent oxidoreductase n=1 Tax=Micromonospora sp. NPDC005707 TaxID=3157050 RepID=UPI0033D82826